MVDLYDVNALIVPLSELLTKKEVEVMEWTQLLPLIAGGIALLGLWGAVMYRLGRLEARMDSMERQQAEARADNIRQHEETRAEFRRQINLVLQVMREHTHADGSPAIIPVPVDIDGD